MASPSNTRRLKALMTQHQLSCADVAALLNRATQTVAEWRCDNSRNISDGNLALLESKLAARGAA